MNSSRRRLPPSCPPLLPAASEGAHRAIAGTARSDMASVVAPPPSAPPRFTARTPDPARFAAAPRAASPAHPPAGDDHLARVVEHLERELSRREASERRLARELDAARADIAERDAQIEDVCAQWERSVTQMQAARDEDVHRVAERLDFVERTEVPALRAQLEQCETRCLRAQASAESLAAKLEAAEAENRSLAADGERRAAIAVAEAAAAARESDALLRDAERRRETELAALQKRAERALREKEAFFELERERMRKNVDAVVAGAVANERLRAETIRGARAALEPGTDRREPDATLETPDVQSMRVSEDGPAERAAMRASRERTEAPERSPEESRASGPGPSPSATSPTKKKRDERLSPSADDDDVAKEGDVDGVDGGDSVDGVDGVDDSVTASTTVDTVDAQRVPSMPTAPEEAPREGERFPATKKNTAPRPSPKPRAAPPPLPVPARGAREYEYLVTPLTDRGPTYVPSALVPPPPPR